MSSALFIENKSRRTVRKKTLSQRIEFGITSLTFFTIVLIAIVSLVYLTHANQNATKGYILKELQVSQANLLTANEVLDMQKAEKSSLRSLEEDVKIRSMVKPEQPLYVRGDSLVAYKKR